MTKLIALLAAVVALLGGFTVYAVAADTECGTAKDAVTAKQTAYDGPQGALTVAIARARELGVTDANINLATAALNDDGKLDATEQADLLKMFADVSTKVDLVNDKAKLQAVLDTRLALNAAIAARDVACGTTSTVAPPTVAPAAGDGSSQR